MDKLYPQAKIELFLEKLSELQTEFDMVIVPFEGTHLSLESNDGRWLELGCFVYDSESKKFELWEE